MWQLIDSFYSTFYKIKIDKNSLKSIVTAGCKGTLLLSSTLTRLPVKIRVRISASKL